MGRKKDKSFKRILAFYKNVFKIDPPLKIVLDGNFIVTMMNKKLDLKEELTKNCNEIVNLVIPTCIANELKSLESTFPGIMRYILKYKLHECDHQLNPSQCILKLLGKKNFKKYLVATQDMTLRKIIRHDIPGVPIIFFYQNMILLEKPSTTSLLASEKREDLKQQPTKDEKKNLSVDKIEINKYMKDEYMKSSHFKRILEEQKLMKINGRSSKKAQSPNPLSRLKKKNADKKIRKSKKVDTEEEDNKKPRNRNRLRRYVKRVEKRKGIKLDYNNVKEYLKSSKPELFEKN